MQKYLPILKSKRGEFKSLSALTSFNKSQIIPCIELLVGFTDLTYQQLSEIWTFEGNEIIIDSSYFTTAELGIEYIELLERLRSAGVQAIPVIEINSPQHLIDLVKDYINKYNSKLCIRIRGEYLYGSASNADIVKLIKNASVELQDTILILDSEDVNSQNLKFNIDHVILFIKGINNASKYYLIASTSGSFPENLSKIDADTIKNLPRIEWEIWKRINAKLSLSNLIYGDYGIKHPLIDPGTTPFEGTCSIKYTTEDYYIIFRGIRSSDHATGSAQYHEKCKLVVAHPLYDGKSFSWADGEIDECSKRIVKPGNGESWVKIGHNHHFVKILSLL